MRKFKKNQAVTLEILGRKINAVYLNEGSFCQAFLDTNDGDTVYLVGPCSTPFGEDKAKEAMVDAYDQKNPYLPAIFFLGCDNVFGTFSNIYEMPFYEDLSSKDKAWLEVKKLQKIRDDAMHEVYDKYKKETGEKGSLRFLGNEMNALIVKKAKQRKFNPNLLGALTALEKHAKITPGMSMEFNKSNVGKDRAGQLILRDAIYDAEIAVAIKRAHRQKVKK